MPVLGRGPRYVNEVLDDGLRHSLAHELGQQVEVIIVADDYGGLLQGPGLIDHGVGEGLVHRYVAGFPGIMHGGIDVGVVGRVPHVVLQEPEQRIAEDVVVLVVNAPGGHHVT